MRMLLTAAAALLLTPAAPAMPITARSRSVQPGEVVVLSIVAPEAATALHVRAFDRDVVAYRDGDRAVARARRHRSRRQAAAPIAVTSTPVPARRRTRPTTWSSSRASFRTRRLTVNEAFVTPPPSEQERIEREAALLAGVWRAPAAERLWTGAVRPARCRRRPTAPSARAASSTASRATRMAAPIS